MTEAVGFGQLGSLGKMQRRPGRLRHWRARDSVKTHEWHALSAAIDPWKRQSYLEKVLVFLPEEIKTRETTNRLPRFFVRSSQLGLDPCEEQSKGVYQVRARPDRLCFVALPTDLEVYTSHARLGEHSKDRRSVRNVIIFFLSPSDDLDE